MAEFLPAEWVRQQEDSFVADTAARMARNAVATADAEQLSLDRQIVTSIDSSVSDRIDDAGITDQKHSGRCWAFAGLNVLRARVINQLNLKQFEFSQNYVYFHDKIEKAYCFLNRCVREADRSMDDRVVIADFETPIGDGGYWGEFVQLVRKYGVVPHYAMPDTHSAENSSAMNDHLSMLLRRAGLALRKAVAAGDDPEPIIDSTMRDVYRMLAIHLGTPPADFVWQYRDKNDVFTREGRLTPLEFAQLVLPDDLDDYVVVAHDPRPGIELNTLYGIDRSSRMESAPTQNHITATIDVLKNAAIAAIHDGEPVWFACDVKKQSDKKAGVWDAHLHDYEGLYGVQLTMTKAERMLMRGTTVSHAMCLTGVDLVDGAPRRWRVENSWGDTHAEKGYWTMNDSWFDEYVYQVVVAKHRLPDQVRAGLANDPIILPSWDVMA